MVADYTTQAEQIMQDFAIRTHLIGGGEPVRYLWTDAFAVCNFLGLYEHQKDPRYLDLAKKLVDQVHATLGRYREDDPRTGWLSGLPDEAARRHPTLVSHTHRTVRSKGDARKAAGSLTPEPAGLQST